MKTNKSAFTMIELIFVIVILGILAAVAIPKLAATRNDATASTIATSAATCVNDAGGAYMMNAAFDDTAGNDIFTNTAACNDALGAGTNPACYAISGVDTTGVLTVADGADIADDVCAKAKVLTEKNSLHGTHQF